MLNWLLFAYIYGLITKFIFWYNLTLSMKRVLYCFLVESTTLQQKYQIYQNVYICQWYILGILHHYLSLGLTFNNEKQWMILLSNITVIIIAVYLHNSDERQKTDIYTKLLLYKKVQFIRHPFIWLAELP